MLAAAGRVAGQLTGLDVVPGDLVPLLAETSAPSASRQALHRLAATADVLIEGFRPGVADRLGAMGPAGGPPALPLNVVADLAGGGLLAAFGICAALVERDRSGRGQHITAAMTDGVLSMMEMWLNAWRTPLLPERGLVPG